MDAQESRDIYEIFTERHRAGSMIVTSNRGPDEWLATFADPVRAQSAIDRFTNNAYDLVIEGETYRRRHKPRHDHAEEQLMPRRSGCPASKGPIDGAGPAGAVDAQTDARPQLLGRRPTDADAHSPLENRHKDAGFPHRQQAAASGSTCLKESN